MQNFKIHWESSNPELIHINYVHILTMPLSLPYQHEKEVERSDENKLEAENKLRPVILVWPIVITHSMASHQLRKTYVASTFL